MECIDIYKSIVDTVDNVKTPFDILYAVTLVNFTPNLVLSAYLGLIKLKTYNGDVNIGFLSGYMIRIMYYLQDFAILFVPAISSGLMAHQVKELLNRLQNRLLQERSEDHAATIELFISYVSARPLELTLYDVIKLDWSLPIAIFNLCVTYQIVVVQLTHMY
ncbi:uncharacterized protein LOC135082790 [Ostrinia nubilalis]|uniref:uncharacterized protein LOC135082790 n=1 Tax=Ostrinia nubilalis TaxID=29057 RepID=UPI0030825158